MDLSSRFVWDYTRTIMADQPTASETALNLTSESEAALFSYSYAEAVIITIVNPILLALCLVGNFACLFTIARVRRMWTVINVYLADLTVTAVVFLVVGVSSAIARYRASPAYGDFGSFGPVGCATVFVLQDVATWASFIFAAKVTVVLYYAVCRPYRYRRLGGRKRAAGISLGIWLLSLGAGLCFLPSWFNFISYRVTWPDAGQFDEHPGVIGVCSPEADWLQVTHDLIQSTFFFACLVNSSVLFAIITKTLSRQLRSVRPATDNSENNRTTAAPSKMYKNRNRITRMLALSALAFFGFPLPHECILFARSIARLSGTYVLSDEQFKELLVVSTTLLNITPTICPYIYVLSNPGYRSALVEAFTRGCYKRDHRSVIRDGEMSTTAQ